MKWKESDKERLKKIIKQVSGNIEAIEGDLLESTRIKGHGDIWCYGPLVNGMVRVRRSTQVYIISEEKDKKGRVLAYTLTGSVILIKKSELIEIGLN